MSQGRSLDTRNKLLEVAEKEFALSGFAGARLQQIAEQVGVQKTALYYYFPSKAALYLAVLQRILRALDATLDTSVQGDGPAARRLNRVLDDFNSLLAEHPYYSRILLRVFVDQAPVDFSAISESIQRIIGRLLRFYREGVEQGDFRRVSARHLFQSLFGATLLHYAAPQFSAAVLDVDDIFTSSAVAWRRDELRRLMAHGVLPDGSESPGKS